MRPCAYKVQRLEAELDLSLAPDGRLVDYQAGPAGKLGYLTKGRGVLIVAPDLPFLPWLGPLEYAPASWSDQQL